VIQFTDRDRGCQSHLVCIDPAAGQKSSLRSGRTGQMRLRRHP
jgi:hypothetical protein